MKLWTSAVQKHGNSVNNLYLGVFVAIGGAAVIIVFFTAGHLFRIMVPTSAANLHESLLSTTMSAPLVFFTSTPTGTTLNRFSQDLSLVDTELPLSLIQVCGPFCIAIIQIVFICISAAYFAAILPVVIAVLYFLQKYYLRTSRQIRLLDLEAKSPLYSHFLETVQGVTTIRAFGWQKEFANINLELLDQSQKPFYLMFCIQRWLALVLDLIVAGLAVVLMVMIVKLRDDLDPGFVALALLNVMSFNNNLTAVIQMWTALETSLGAIARLRTFGMTTPSENLERESSAVDAEWPLSGSVVMRNATLSFTMSL
jgi:ATP-binding cassette, subfamily C (CFTR/MRP), member 1